MEEQTQENMELAQLDEQVYQLELQAFQTTLPYFKYEPPSLYLWKLGPI
jgi:hypothetical protein